MGIEQAACLFGVVYVSNSTDLLIVVLNLSTDHRRKLRESCWICVAKPSLFSVFYLVCKCFKSHFLVPGMSQVKVNIRSSREKKHDVSKEAMCI